MRLPLLWAAVLWWQSSLLVNIGTVADPAHLRFERVIELPELPASGAAAYTCVPLDATVLAHTASGAHDDLRVYRGYPGSLAQTEVPFLLTESGPEPVAAAQVAAEHVERTAHGFRFDLRMPARAYSEVQLELALRNFVGTVHVSAAGANGRRGSLGTFGIFDLSDKGLGRWTVLPMAETSAPLLHVEMSLRTPEGLPIEAPRTGVGQEVIEGAAVPPSRERQTVYTPVAESGSIATKGMVSVAVLRVEAHVPVERVAFTLAPGFAENFDRRVLVSARPDREDAAQTEMMDAGAIQHVAMASGDPGLNPIDVTQVSVEATLGATLASNATVRVSVVNGALPPLPIRRVRLEMREREVCFFADPEASYTLRYGDPALPAPLYDNTPMLAATAAPIAARLGPERRNPGWRRRTDERPLLSRHPELFWLVVLLCGGMMGGTALHFVQHREGGARG